MRKNDTEIPARISQAYLLASASALPLPSDNLDREKSDDTSGCDSDALVLGEFNGPKMITFDGDQTLYSDGSNFDSNPNLASYLCQLLKQGVIVAVVTAAGYEYNVEKYEFRLSGLLNYFKAKKLTAEQCERFLLFGGECNYLLAVSIKR
jgi:IMP-specific 5'-nucleotidase